MKKFNLYLLFFILILFTSIEPQTLIISFSYSQPKIIDHTCTNIDLIPDMWISKAKSQFRVSYGHTSHGKQIITGMYVLEQDNILYSFNHYGTYESLSFRNRELSGDLGNPNRVEWYYRTRNLLDNPNNDRNLIMWAWCGQVNSATENDIETYLSLMSQLETDHPDVTFIYMTGHLEGTGVDGNLHKRNNQIREYCVQNNKILYDFADIESYDPDGNYFLDKLADDDCNYDSNKDGILDSNWAAEWLARNPDHKLSILTSQCGECGHSHRLNCVLKGRAFWWMLAKLAGWGNTDCDFNQDGIISSQDYSDKQDAELEEYEKWVTECWEQNQPCGDFNNDGIVNMADKEEKYDSIMRGLIDWSNNCGFNKKAYIKR